MESDFEHQHTRHSEMLQGCEFCFRQRDAYTTGVEFTDKVWHTVGEFGQQHVVLFDRELILVYFRKKTGIVGEPGLGF